MLERKNTESLAKYLYNLEGRPQGQDIQIWLEAERQLRDIVFEREDTARSERN